MLSGKMKNKLLKHIFKKIKDNNKRFLSLFCMAFLGVGFFTGIQSCGPDMLKTLDNYYDENNVYDIEIISNLGLTNNDIEELKKILNQIDSNKKVLILGRYNFLKNEILKEKDFSSFNDKIIY